MSQLDTSVKNGVLYLTLNTPEAKNALDDDMMGAIRDAVTDPKHRDLIVLLSAKGEMFSMGRPPRKPTDKLSVRDSLARVLEVNKLLADHPQPVVAAVRGGVNGAACGLIVHADVVIASDKATFSYPEMTHDLPPTLVISYLESHVGPKAARYLVLTGRSVGAETARNWGLASEVVPDGQLEAAAEKLLDEMRSRKPGSLAVCKQALRRYPRMDKEIVREVGLDRVVQWLQEGK